MDKIVLDLETQKTFDEVGGHHNNHKLGVSVCGVYSYERNEFRAFKEEEFKELLEWLRNAELIIGFNSKSFDFAVLQPYIKNFDLSRLPHLDILEEVVHALGFRLKLDSIAQETLGYGKSGDGLDAIKYYRAGDWDSLIKYCLDDVRITKEIYDYGLSHGNLWFHNNGRRESIPIRWQQGESVNDLVNRAFRQGLQLNIFYINDDGQASEHKVDIKELKNNKFKAFSHTTNSLNTFDISRIKSAKEVGQMGSWQQGLF